MLSVQGDMWRVGHGNAESVLARLRLTWQKVVADQHAKQHEVVDDALQIVFEAQDFRRLLKLQLEVVTEQAHLVQCM